LAKAATEDRIREVNTAENWSEFVYAGYPEHKPPTPMNIFVRGLEPTLGRSISNTLIRRLSRSPVEVEPLLGIFPCLDLGLVIQIVLSLFVLLFTYDAVCGEKEGGTLRLIASFPTPRYRLLLGKLLGALIPTLAAFGLPLLLGIAAMFLMPEVRLTGPELIRLGMITVAFGLYLTTFTCAGLFASILTHRASTSFVLLLGFWVVSVVVLPRLSLITADGIRPSPSVYELDAEKDAVIKSNGEMWRDSREKWAKEYLKSTGKEFWRTPEGNEAYRLYWRKTREEVSMAPTRLQHERLEEAFRNRYDARLDLAVALARFSPAFALDNATVRLAGAGLDRQRRFLNAFTLYYRQHQHWYIESVDRSELQRINPAKYGKYKWDISDMPRFAYRETWPQEDVQTALVDMGVLTLCGLAFFVGAYVAMLRYDLR